MDDQKVACTACGNRILPATASRNGGLCLPCRNGTRKSIDRAVQLRNEERERDRTDPWQIHWRRLVGRLGPGGSLDSLTEVERLYFAVYELDAEVHNGGFDQYFWNASGSNCALAAQGLEELGAAHSLALLVEAREVLFGGGPVPLAPDVRRELLEGVEPDEMKRRTQRLDALDDRYYEDPDGLAARLQAFAVDRGLVKPR